MKCSESVCYGCAFFRKIPEYLSGPMEDCYPEEVVCSMEMDNFLTDEGCYKYVSD